jgi:hypothetical protein
MYGNVDMQLDPPDEQPGVLPEIASVTLDGGPIDDYRIRRTNRGNEVLVKAAPDGEQTLVVEVR